LFPERTGDVDDGERDSADRIELDAGNRLLRVYFEPGTDIGGAIAQISAISSTGYVVCRPE